MTKMVFSINAEAWINGIEIEGKSVEDCKEQLYSMTLAELVELGNVKQSEISDVDSELLEEDVEVHVDDIMWNYDDEDEEEVEAVQKLPKEFDFTVHVEYEDITSAITDEIYDRTGYEPLGFDYEEK